MSITGDVATDTGENDAGDTGQASAVTATLANLAPGPAMIAYLCSLDGASLDAFERVEVLKAWDRQHAWLMAHTHQAILAVAGPPPRDDDDDDWQRDEVAAALLISGRAAASRIHHARTLTRCLPRTRAALTAGTITWRHALTLLDETLHLPDDAIRAVETAVLDAAPTQNPAQFTRAVRRAVIATAPVHAELAHEIARTDRRVWLQPEPDGMATLAAFLPAAQARAAYQAIDHAARHNTDAIDPHTGEKLGLDARRADAFIALLTTSPLAGPPDEPGNTRTPNTEIQIVIDLPTLLGLTDHPGELIGYGPIPAGMARDLATDATWRRLVTDPVDGHLLDYGNRTYRPPTRLANYTRTRDRTCRFPGCHQPATHCDIDHNHPHARGGPTAARNCACLCRRHHRLKTHAGWHYTIHPTGAITWTSPTKNRYHLGPPTQYDIGPRHDTTDTGPDTNTDTNHDTNHDTETNTTAEGDTG